MPEIIWDVEQGSDEWLDLRMGIPTASEFGRIITESGSASSQRGKYITSLAAQRLTRSDDGNWTGNSDTERGHMLEGEAADAYRDLLMLEEAEPKVVGIVFKDDSRKVACSPDRLLMRGDEIVGGHEIKCPRASTVADYILNSKRPYKQQVHGSMWVCEVESWTLIVYHRVMGIIEIEYKWDWYTDALGKAVEKFVDDLDAAVDKLAEYTGLKP